MFRASTVRGRCARVALRALWAFLVSRLGATGLIAGQPLLEQLRDLAETGQKESVRGVIESYVFNGGFHPPRNEIIARLQLSPLLKKFKDGGAPSQSPAPPESTPATSKVVPLLRRLAQSKAEEVSAT